MPDNEATHIKDEWVDIWQCNNCGAYAPELVGIKHHDSCKKGEAKYWEKFYEDANREEELCQ